MQTVHELSEREDEDQIVKEMRGEILEHYVYSFPQGGRTVTGLSYAGVKQYVRRRGHFYIFDCECCKKPVHVDETAEEFRATVKIRDLENDVEVIGVSVCEKKKPFAYVLAVNKAERNALRKLIPEKELAMIIREFSARQGSSPLRPQ